MHPIISTILSGIFVSMAGSLPLGNLNITAMHIASKEPLKQALKFSFGVVLIEMLYLRITLQLISYVSSNTFIFKNLQWLTVVLLIALAIGSFYGAAKKQAEAKNVLIDNNIDRFLLGIGMSAVNPIQVPYWGGWAIYLITQGWMQTGNIYYNTFTLSAGLGTSLALLIFILVGVKMAAYMQRNRRAVLVITGVLFLIIAGLQLFNIYK